MGMEDAPTVSTTWYFPLDLSMICADASAPVKFFPHEHAPNISCNTLKVVFKNDLYLVINELCFLENRSDENRTLPLL